MKRIAAVSMTTLKRLKASVVSKRGIFMENSKGKLRQIAEWIGKRNA